MNNTLLTNTNNSLNNTYHTSVSQAKNKPSSLRVGIRVQKPLNTTFAGSCVNKNKMSNKTKSSLHNSYIGSSNHHPSNSNKHNILVSSFNLSNKNDIKNENIEICNQNQFNYNIKIKRIYFASNSDTYSINSANQIEMLAMFNKKGE